MELIDSNSKICRNCSSPLTLIEGDYYDKWHCETCQRHREYVETEGCCKSPDIQPVKIETKTGSIVKKQCLNCGEYASTAISKKSFDMSKIQEQIPKRKEAALLKDTKEFENAWEKNGENEQQKFWREYNEYLKSDVWKNKRLKVLERDSHTCQACLMNVATEVHHLSYMMIYQEPLFDLISVCNECHDSITQITRERRADNFFRGKIDYLLQRRASPF